MNGPSSETRFFPQETKKKIEARKRWRQDRQECQGARVREICITNEVSDYVGDKVPSLWIIGGQEFDDAEPILLILPVRLQIVFALRSSKDLIVSAFRKHSGQMKRVFSELSPEDLRGLEVKLKKVGKRAATLMEES